MWPPTKYVQKTCWCGSASAVQSASWNPSSPYWMLGPGPTWVTEVKGLLLALKMSTVWYLKTVPLVPPPRTVDSGPLLAGHHVSCGILTGTLKSRGRVVYFVIPLLLFLWQFPSFSILDSPNRRAIWWLHSQKIDKKPVGDLWITRRGDRSARHPDLGGVGHAISGLSQSPARSCQGAMTANPACNWCGWKALAGKMEVTLGPEVGLPSPSAWLLDGSHWWVSPASLLHSLWSCESLLHVWPPSWACSPQTRN